MDVNDNPVDRKFSEIIVKLFRFIESKRPKYKAPLRFKLLFDPESITEADLKVDDLYVSDTNITQLPDNLTVYGNLYMSNTPITTLPDNLTVGDILFADRTKIASIPNNLKVGGNLLLTDTPLHKQYTNDEIRKIIEDKGGSVGGRIIMYNR